MSESHCIKLRIMETFISMWGISRESSGCCYETINDYQGFWNNTSVGGATPHRNPNDTLQYNFFSFSWENQTHNFTVEISGKAFSWSFKVKTSCIFNACIPWLHFSSLSLMFPFLWPVFTSAPWPALLSFSSLIHPHLLPACCFIWLFRNFSSFQHLRAVTNTRSRILHRRLGVHSEGWKWLRPLFNALLWMKQCLRESKIYQNGAQRV